MPDEVYIALDMGGTKLLAAAIDRGRNVIARERAQTPRSLQEGLSLLKQMVRTVAGGSRILAIGVSAGGPLQHETGVLSSLHFPEWHEVPFKQIMEAEFGCPLRVEVDTDAAVLAEYRFGGHSIRRLLYVTLSTGVGGGFMIDGELYRGVDGSHPEVGHHAAPYRLPVAGPISCTCGANDCLEAIISGSAVKKHYGKPAEDLLPEEWDEVAYNLGQGLRNLAAVYAPELIVLGGGMALGGGAKLLETARTVVRENLKIVPQPRIEFSTLGYDTALWGGVALALSAISE